MRRTVAVVDDDLAIGQALRGALDVLGYDCLHFRSGEEFLLCDRENIGCIILDVDLPGVNGLDLQNALLGLHCDVPIVFLSSRITPALRRTLVERGAIDVLDKPCCIELLDRSLRAAMPASET
jgi:FixJ family two-component response regulator